ncbi:MAG: PhzF family phenazine biosynthesis protein [Bacteroidia bacterium]|nr:PhzF family phenazine biosynthesis protein [Bacteroidia bacterium]
MEKLRIYQVDAFTDRLFAGNPAAVCPLDDWLDERTMQDIAAENNLAETAFLVQQEDVYHIRWFTPTVEVDLCGHATLAAAHVLFNHLGVVKRSVTFHSHRSGILEVRRSNNMLTMNLPTDDLTELEIHPDFKSALGKSPVRTFLGKTDYMMVFQSEDEIRTMDPDLMKLRKMPARGVIVTAPGDHTDFVSRFFAPQSGVDEDPVTGSAHTSLTPYWSKELNKKDLTAVQLSKRTGLIQCRDLGKRTEISGSAVTYLIGEINIV